MLMNTLFLINKSLVASTSKSSKGVNVFPISLRIIIYTWSDSNPILISLI